MKQTVLVVLIGHFLATSSLAAAPRALPAGELPEDTRLGPLRGEQGDFNLVPTKSPESYKDWSFRVRHTMQVALGLWPMPTKTPLQAVIHGKVEREDYTVEKVYFQSLPGLYVTGSLYRPVGKKGRLPAVLSPHGHFPGGRFQDAGVEATRRQIDRGAERFEEGGRSFMQSRCVQLARMGCVVFLYDMIGYGDSQQLSQELVHRFSRSRVKYKQPPRTGFYSAGAESRLHNMMGLHTYHSIRALDFLVSLPDVDPERIAVTGGSGGGTQTFMLCAIDNRPKVSVPVVIVSTTRQGGCTCENICGLRIDTNNIEFTALHAPKPLLLVSADDATRSMPERGFPELQAHYAALGAKQNVAHAALLQFPHNYNYVSRAAMYDWLNQHLQLGLKQPIRERDYIRLSREEATVWNQEHQQPKGGAEVERDVLRWLNQDADRQLAELLPSDPDSLIKYREVVGRAWETLLRQLPSDTEIRFEKVKVHEQAGRTETVGLLTYPTIEKHQAVLPMVIVSPKKTSQRTVIWVDKQGKAGLYDGQGQLKAPIQRLINAGVTVMGVDLLYQGEFLADGKPVIRQRAIKGEEAFAGWTYCYNQPVFAQRVHDVQAVLRYAQSQPASRVGLVGLAGAGHWVAATAALSDSKIENAAIDTAGFRFAAVKDVYHVDFQPGAVKYGDLPSLLALATPTKLWLAGEDGKLPPLVQAAYQSVDKLSHVTLVEQELSDPADSIVDWLLRLPRR